jgi:hypothetical protein
MGDVIDIHDWVEQKVNVLAQRFRSCKDTAHGKQLERVLKGWGFKMAKYKIHYLRTERARIQREQDQGNQSNVDGTK